MTDSKGMNRSLAEPTNGYEALIGHEETIFGGTTGLIGTLDLGLRGTAIPRLFIISELKSNTAMRDTANSSDRRRQV